ncbi:MAG: methionine synthase [Sulfitobacter sp.]
MAWFFGILAAGFALLWACAYVYVSGLACAFGNVNGSCKMRGLFELSGEDFQIMVLYPGLTFLALVAATVYFARRKAR